MRRRNDLEGPGGSGETAWLRVDWVGHARHPLRSVAARALGELAYRLLARGGRGILPAYAEVAPGRLSRSGQPAPAAWRHLRDRGTRTVVNLRREDDGAQRLRSLGFTGYLHLPIPDGLPPTDEQAAAFLRFVGAAEHWPVHMHCLTGVQRSGVMAALVRYAVQGWPMRDALRESFTFFPGPGLLQVGWLKRWATQHPAGEWSWTN